MVVKTTAGWEEATLVVRGCLRERAAAPPAAPAVHATQHTIPTTQAIGSTINRTIPAMVTPTIRPTMSTAERRERDKKGNETYKHVHPEVYIL